MPPRVLDIDGFEWRVRALPETTRYPGEHPWRYVKIRYEPDEYEDSPAREAWVMLEEDVPARDVLDQYEDDYLEEVFMVAEEVREADA